MVLGQRLPGMLTQEALRVHPDHLLDQRFDADWDHQIFQLALRLAIDAAACHSATNENVRSNWAVSLRKAPEQSLVMVHDLHANYVNTL